MVPKTAELELLLRKNTLLICCFQLKSALILVSINLMKLFLECSILLIIKTLIKEIV